MINKRKSRFLISLFLFLLALGVRFSYLEEFQYNPFFDTIVNGLDHFNFDQAAINFAEGDLLARSPNNSFSPLYKYFLGVLYWLFGRNFYVIYSVQFALGALGSVLVYWIGRDLFGTRAGLIAFFGFALYSTQIFYEGILLRASFITFLGLLSFFLLTRLQKELTISRLVVATLALSLFFQARPNTLLCLPPVLVFLHCYVFRGKPGGEVARSWSVFTGVLLLSFIPLLVQCYVVHGRFVFFDASGPHTFIAGNLTSYSGVGFEEKVVEDYRKQNILGYGSNIQYLLGHIAQSPWEFFKLYLRKLYFFFNDFEAPSNLSVYLYREFSEWSGNLLNHFALYSSLGLAGMVLAARQKKPVFLLASYALALTLSVVLFLNESRYRLPAAPYYILFGSYALSTLIGWTFQKRFKDAAILAVVSALLFFTFMEPKGVTGIRQIDYCNAGKAYLENERLFDLAKVEHYAIQCWNAESKTDPEHPFSKYLLATVYDLQASFLFQHKKRLQAAKFLQQSIDVLPFHAHPFKLLALLYKSLDQKQRGIRALGVGIVVDPRDKSLYEILVNMYGKGEENSAQKIVALRRWLAMEEDEQMRAALQIELNRLEQKIEWEKPPLDFSIEEARGYYQSQQWQLALPEYQRINKFNSSDDALFLELGVTLGNLQQYDEAFEALYNGLLISPGNRDIHRILANYYLLEFVNAPILAMIHLSRYLEQPVSPEDYRVRHELYLKIRDMYGFRQREKQIGPLTVADNKKIFALYRNQ